MIRIALLLVAWVALALFMLALARVRARADQEAERLWAELGHAPSDDEDAA